MFKLINLYLVNLQLVRGQFFQKDKKTITNKKCQDIIVVYFFIFMQKQVQIDFFKIIAHLTILNLKKVTID